MVKEEAKTLLHRASAGEELTIEEQELLRHAFELLLAWELP